MNHLEQARRKADEPQNDLSFLSWLAKVEDMLGTDMVHDSSAYPAFLEGASVVEYVLDVKGREADLSEIVKMQGGE